MEDNKFWVLIWILAAATTVALMTLCVFNAYDRRDKWEKAVSNGADPMVVSCALYEQTGVEQAACLLLAQNRK